MKIPITKAAAGIKERGVTGVLDGNLGALTTNRNLMALHYGGLGLRISTKFIFAGVLL
jgi:hypothetical protein